MMRLNLTFALLLLLTLPAVSLRQSEAQSQAETYAFEPIVTELDRPLYVTNAGDERLFVVTQDGRIVILLDGELLPRPFLDIRRAVDSMYFEEGLHSIAFDPDYDQNGYFYVQYSTENQNAVIIDRRQVSPVDPNRASRLDREQILRVPKLWDNHNGGQLQFGPDGYLYSSLGDGGSHNDPRGNGQNGGSLLGTILRLDVSEMPYSIPPDNPFVDEPLFRPEIYVYGLRNPWRFSFDDVTGDLYIADVGQNFEEEINVLPAGDPGGQNFGWNVYEGNRSFLASVGNVDASRFTFPDMSYPHVEHYRFFTDIRRVRCIVPSRAATSIAVRNCPGYRASTSMAITAPARSGPCISRMARGSARF